MKINITGKHINLGEALKEYINERLANSLKQKLSHVTSVDIIFSKHAKFFDINILIHDTIAGIIKGTSESNDVYSAFDEALIKIEKQLRKYKSKIISKHHKAPKDSKSFDDNIVLGTKYTLSPSYIDENESHFEPITIAEKATNIENLTVSEAVMKMDLAHLPALLFINKANNRLNVVYHRSDGNISWVDPGDR